MSEPRHSSSSTLFDDGRVLKSGAAGPYGRLSKKEYKVKNLSVDRQLAVIHEFFSEHPSDFSTREKREYKDVGVSGTTFNRPGVNRLRDDIKADIMSCVLVRDLRRLGRNTKEGLEFLDLCTNHGVIIIDISQPSVDFTSTAGRKIFTDAMSSAESERGTHWDNSIYGQTDRVAKGQWKGGLPPVGYRVEDGYLKMAEDGQSAYMTRFFALVRLNPSPTAILAALIKAEDTMRPVNKGKGPDGKPLVMKCAVTLQWIAATLDNPTYAGYNPGPRLVTRDSRCFKPILVLPNGSRYFDSMHPRFITRDEWSAWYAKRHAAHRPTSRTSTDAPAFILQGLLRCGCCDNRNLRVGAGTSDRGQIVRSYVCHELIRRGAASECTVRRVPAIASETAVIRFLELLAQHPELVGGVVTALAKTKQGAEGNLAGKESELRAELARVARAKKTIVNRLLECGETPLGEAIKERFNQADQRETALRMQLDELHESHGAAVSVKPTRDSIEEALAAFEKTVEDLPAAKVKQIIRMLVNDIKVTRIDHTHTPQFAHLAASSMVLKFDLTLSPTGIHYSNSPALAERWSASEKKSHERKAKFAVTFEIRRCGRQGNQVHLLEPISADAKIIEFSQGTSARQGPPTSSTPLSRLDEIQGYLAKGMKKKEVAEKFGKTAAWVSYHLRLSSLSDKIVKALCGAPASVSAAFGLVRLMSIAAIKGKVQQEATFDLEYRRASNSGSGRRRGAGSLMRISSEKRLALLAQFQSSGMSMAAFAEQQGIKYPTFAGWIASDKRRAAANATATQG